MSHNPVRRRAVAILFGVVVAFVAAEGLLRLTGGGVRHETSRTLVDTHDPSVYWQCYDANPNGEMSPLPDVSRGRWQLRRNTIPPELLPLDRIDETPWCIEYRSGSEGVRGPAVSPVPAPGRLRIVGVGDSFAHGDGVPEDKTLFAHLGRELGPDVEVVNCGKSGADMGMVVRVLDWTVGAYRPHRAIVVFIPNDVRLSPQLQARQDFVYDLINVRAEQSGDEPSFLEMSRVIGLFTSWSRMRRTTDATLALYRDIYDPAKNGTELDRFRGELRKLAMISGGNAVLVLYPLMYGFEGGYPLRFVHDQVRTMAEAEGLRVLDLAPVFDGADTASLRVHPVDHHPNGTAHGKAAAALARWLRDDVPGFLSPPR